MQNNQLIIAETWQSRHELALQPEKLKEIQQILEEVMAEITAGKLRVCERSLGGWVVNEWVKQAIVLFLQLFLAKGISAGPFSWYDKMPLYVLPEQPSFRSVPGAIIRHGCYIGLNAIIMPSFINLGAYIGDRTMIDSNTTIGSCAQIGKNCHISANVGIGGVLEPLQAKPVIIEDNCFIGAGSMITEGVIIEEGAVISMGVMLGGSTKIVNRANGQISYGKIPAYSVVVPGSIADPDSGININCAVIIKQVDAKTREKVSLNELLRT